MKTLEPRYVHVHVTYVGRLGVEVGVFVAVDHLRRAGRLSIAEEQTYFDVDDWFREHLPGPPFSADGNSIGAVTWFKVPSAGHMLERLEPLRAILQTHDVPHCRMCGLGALGRRRSRLASSACTPQ